MSTTQHAPADTRTPAQKDYDYGAELFEKQPGLSATKTGALSLMVAALNRQIAELRESKATKALVQELAEALADQAIDLKALRSRLDRLISLATTSGIALEPAPAPTIESLIAEIEAAGWTWKLYGFPGNGGRQVFIRKTDSEPFVSHGWSHHSLVAALQEALTTARQAVKS